MFCPKCRNPRLDEITFPHSNVAVDRCPTCWGLWFDGGELEQVLQIPAGKLQVMRIGEPTKLSCPRCGGVLSSVHYPHTDVTVDVCDACEGVWLDNGEFPRIRAWHQSLEQQDFAELDTHESRSEEFLRSFLADMDTATMLCPRCQKPALEELDLDYSGVVLDRCLQCGGVWFDGGELEQVLKEAARDVHLPDEMQPCGLPCPRCETEMSSFQYPDTEVTVDMCNECRGLWLDHGEFKQIRKMRGVPGPASGEPGKGRSDEERSGAFARLVSRVVTFLGS